jgi:GNAT superfamily N-acetyltransferase
MEDAADLVALHIATNQHLTSQFGPGFWSGEPTERGVLFRMRLATVYIARYRKRLIATFALQTKKPWAIGTNDTKYFTPCTRPIYLTSMAVHPDYQRKGVGRTCLEAAYRAVKQWPGDAIRLDAFDADAGAGGFYAKCDFRKVGGTPYRNNPLIYFERLVTE